MDDTVYMPMLADLAEKPFNGKGWLFEPKYDGIRAIIYYREGNIKILNRSLKDITHRFPEIKLSCTVKYAIFDGEIVCRDVDGIPDFQLMQIRMNREKEIQLHADLYPANYFAFDILSVYGRDITQWSLGERKDLLPSILNVTESTCASEYIVEYGIDYLAKHSAWEGIMAKKLNSKYYPGIRSKKWLKIKPRTTEEVFCVGYSTGTGKRKDTLGALVTAELRGDKFIYLGDVGTGYTDIQIAQLKELCDSHIRTRPIIPALIDRKVRWCRPFIIRVSSLERTNANKLRFPSYEGLPEE